MANHYTDIILNLYSKLDTQISLPSFLQDSAIKWFSNSYLTWGVGMVLAYVIGFFTFMIPLEILIRQPFMSDYLIEYPKSGTRMENMKKMFSKIPFPIQAHNVFHSLFGVTSILNGITGYYLCCYFIPFDGNINPGTIKDIMIQLVLMNLIGDFFLYWGHRIQHDIPYLWENFHSLHHSLDTPSPLGTIYIHSVDATLQGALPLIFAILSIKPHPIIAYTYVFLRIGENVINHAGIDCLLMNILTLKFLPLRASIGHHVSYRFITIY